MLENKYYFFRELDNSDNFLYGLIFHSAGLVEKIYSENSVSGKDISVTYFHPFSGEVVSNWLSTSEAELFEVSEYEYEQLKTRLNAIEK